MNKAVLKYERKCSQCKKVLTVGTECFYEETTEDKVFGPYIYRNVPKIIFTCGECQDEFEKALNEIEKEYK